MIGQSNSKYKCPRNNSCSRVCLAKGCNAFGLKCAEPSCSHCPQHAAHQPDISLGEYLLEVMQRPAVDIELMVTYERLMAILENDPTLAHMCDELPQWWMERLADQFEQNEHRKCLAQANFTNPRWFTGQALGVMLQESRKQLVLVPETLMQIELGQEKSSEGEQDQPHEELRVLKSTIKQLKQQGKRLALAKQHQLPMKPSSPKGYPSSNKRFRQHDLSEDDLDHFQS